ncbi:hypothetical protein BDQ12DRAFT_678221 [Crucibulum laeve]|uniref:Ubiquitin 3 binding protein But2 C-terminal domain-containing protein n=1 Tax=Crucibulum laeve TaxID=68775 RepID=A0A5C3MKC9_9AGAR|nr:hypothetical protein BDQ12DRAFT_678221 [Crucibulum laeve]
MMKYFTNFTTFLIALSSPLLAKASFPGSTFAISYNTTSASVPSVGQLALLPTAPGIYQTALTSSPSNFAGFFTISGSGGVLHQACPVPELLAVLVPPTQDIEGVKYLLEWRTSDAIAQDPEGSMLEGFQLGPEPTFDTVINVDIGTGSWKAVDLKGVGQYIVAWSEDTTNAGIAISLVKSSAAGITC